MAGIRSSGWRNRVHGGRGRPRVGPTGRLVAGVAVTTLLALAAFMASEGAASMAVSIRDESAWLASEPRGSVTLVDGFAGQPSAEAVLEGSAGHPLQVTQEGDDVLVYDESTGVLSRLDVGQLSAGEARSVLPGVRLVAGPGAAYLVDEDAGTAQAINPDDLSTVGPLVKVPGQFGRGGVDAKGTLWLPRSDRGDVVPVTSAGLGTPVSGVADPGSEVSMSIVGGRSVAVDEKSGRVSLLGSNGVEWQTDAGTTGSHDLVAAPAQEGDEFAVLDRSTGSVTVVDVKERQTRRAVADTGLARKGLGAPVVNDDRVYLPDYDDGKVLVYSTAEGSWSPTVTVTGRPGPFETVQKDGIMYFNDPKSDKAVTIGADDAGHRGPVAVNKHSGVPSAAENSRPPRGGAHDGQAATPDAAEPTGETGTGDRGAAAGTTPTAPVAAPPVFPWGNEPAGADPTQGSWDSRAPSAGGSTLPAGQGGSGQDGLLSSASPDPDLQPTGSPSATPTRPAATSSPTRTASPTPTKPTPTKPTPTKPTPPLAPQGVRATSGAGKVTVSWTAPSGGGVVKSYRVSSSPTGAATTVAASARSASLTGLTCGTRYTFVVTAVGADGTTVNSGRSGAATPCVAPSKPGGLSVVERDAGGFALSWKASAGGGAVTYVIKYSGPTSGTVTTTKTSHVITWDHLEYLGVYTVTVQAKTAAGTSAAASVKARSGGDGAKFKVNTIKSSSTGNACHNPGGEVCDAALRKKATHDSAELLRIKDGTSVTGYCWRAGEELNNDDGTASNKWILVAYSGKRGFTNTLWLGGASAYKKVPECPKRYQP